MEYFAAFVLFLVVVLVVVLFARLSSLGHRARHLQLRVVRLEGEIEQARQAFWGLLQRIGGAEQRLAEQARELQRVASQPAAPRPAEAASAEAASAEAASAEAEPLGAAELVRAGVRAEGQAPAEASPPGASAEAVSEVVADGGAEAAAGEVVVGGSAEANAGEPSAGVTPAAAPDADRRTAALARLAAEHRAMGAQRQATPGAAAAGASTASGPSPPLVGGAAAGSAGAVQLGAESDQAPEAGGGIDLEQWIGVRGAAALGAAILVLAGAYFFKYSVDHELISPAMRVVLGVSVGVACVAGAEAWVRRRHELLANCLSGAGFAILYLSFWAALARYELVSTVVAGGLMVAVTAACCVLSALRHSRAVALFGLVGGFATPLMLSTGSDRPIELFSYLLLLDVAVLYIAARRRWPVLALLSLLGTCGYQALWIIGRMESDRLVLGLGILGLFGILFALAPQPRAAAVASSVGASSGGGPSATAASPAEPSSELWKLTRAAAVLLPFLFTLYFGLRAELTPRLYQTAILLAVLVVGAGWVARREQASWLAQGATWAAVGVLAAWLVTHSVTDDAGTAAWEVVGFAVGLAVLLQAMVELDSWRLARASGRTATGKPPSDAGEATSGTGEAATAGGGEASAAGDAATASLGEAPSPAGAAASTAGAAASTAGAARRPADRASSVDSCAAIWIHACFVLTAVAVVVPSGIAAAPWVVGWSLLAAVAVRHACFPGRAAVSLATAIALGLCWLALGGRHLGERAFPSAAMMMGLAMLTAVGFQLGSLLPRRIGARRAATHAAALLALFMLVLTGRAGELSAVSYVGSTILLALLVCFAALRTGTAQWLIAAAPFVALVQWARANGTSLGGLENATAIVYAGHGVAVLLLTGWPLLFAPAARESRWPYRAAALMTPAFFLTARDLHVDLWGDGFIAVLPLGFAAVVLAAGVALRWRGPIDENVRRSAITWIGAVCLGFVTVAIPLQLRNEWVTIGWALQAVALLAFWRRVDHAGLKYVALALFLAVTVRLVGNPQVLEYHPRSSLPIINWLSYTYVVPTACLLGGWALLNELELPRQRRWEELYGRRPVLAQLFVVCAIVVLFVWINLTIIDWFSVERHLRLSLERMPARDLTISLAWAVYGMVLLAIGMWRVSRGLRSVSLALMLITCAKAFLYDLSHLRDLYRVFSLVGLALSLIVISLAYKRFVFPSPEPAPRDEPTEGAP